MNKSEPKNEKSASGGTASTSGASNRPPPRFVITVNDPDAPFFSPGISLDNYIRRQVVKGLAKHKSMEENKGDTAGTKNDFANLMSVPSDCNFFQFVSEKDWDKDDACDAFSCRKFFNLNLGLLSQGLECLPFYEKIKMEKSKLQDFDIKKCDTKASKALENYKEIRENFEKELEESQMISKSLEDLTGIKWEPRKPKETELEECKEAMEEEFDLEAPVHGKYWVSHRTELKEKGDDSYLAPSSSEESLEVWLDTYLDE